MGNGIGSSNWHPPLKWDPRNIAKSWMSFCSTIMDPIMSMTLWQGGPPPWMMSGGSFNFSNNNSIWNFNQPYNITQNWNTGDSFTSNTSSSSSSTQTQEEQDEAEAKKRQLNKKFEILKRYLEDFESTLDEMDDTEGTLKVKINRLLKGAVTQENYDKLLDIFNENKVGDNVKNKFLESISASKDENFIKKVKQECWTHKDWSSQITITQDNVLQYLATLKIVSKNIPIGTFVNRSMDPDNKKEDLEAHLGKIQKTLLLLAENTYDNKKLSEASKQNLKVAIDKIKNCNPNTVLNKNKYSPYEKDLLNLSALIEKSKREIFEKEHEFLGLKITEPDKPET